MGGHVQGYILTANKMEGTGARVGFGSNGDTINKYVYIYMGTSRTLFFLSFYNAANTHPSLSSNILSNETIWQGIYMRP